MLYDKEVHNAHSSIIIVLFSNVIPFNKLFYFILFIFSVIGDSEMRPFSYISVNVKRKFLPFLFSRKILIYILIFC